ncbi:hypothetical protein D3M70_13975 [Pseudomonas sp. LS-2]|jgi:hypothetical protein|nr:hypothetical protein D3M70_13975 [Pseudomonas sp. LS-2]
MIKLKNGELSNVKAVIMALQALFTLALTFILARWAFSFGWVDFLLRSDIGSDVYIRILATLDTRGCEDSEDLLIMMVLALTLTPSILICRLVSRQLRKLIKKAQ